MGLVAAPFHPRGVPAGTPQRTREAEAPELTGRPPGALLPGALEHRPGLRTDALVETSARIGQALSAGSHSRGVPAGTPQPTREAEAPELTGRPLGAGLCPDR